MTRLFALLVLLPLLLCDTRTSTCESPRIQLFGDSTQMLAAPYWEARWPGRIVDSAVGQTNSRQLLAGQDGRNQPWPASIVAPVVVVKHGTNDGSAGYGLTPIEVYKANLRRFVRTAGTRVVLETPDPNTERDRGPIAQYAQAMREVASETGAPLIDADACWRAHEGWERFLYDGTHATPEGRAFTVEHCAAPVIDALACHR
jgi:lysophospholipase L1-like esterase